MPRFAVVDTNILVSALLKRGTPPDAVVNDIRNGTLFPVVCHEILNEYAAVLTRPRLRLPGNDVDELLGLITGLARWVHLPDRPAEFNLPDPDDWPFIACALATNCPVITGNTKDFPRQLGIEAVTATEWVRRAR